MNPISKAFENGKAFIAFLTCGDPDLETTEKLIVAMAQAGADIIELGIPFSDPTAEGPVIQAANLRALAGGVTTDKILEMVHRVRKRVDIPLAFMTYANVVLSYGTDRFLQAAAQAGISGLILPDVPYEERGDFAPACTQNGIALIPLVAPTSHERIAIIAREAEGFVYCVSSLGVTGERTEIASDIGAMVEQVHAASCVPAAVGFGISKPEQATAVARHADGVIVGSAIVRLVAQHGKACVPHVAEYVRSMKQAVVAAQAR